MKKFLIFLLTGVLFLSGCVRIVGSVAGELAAQVNALECQVDSMEDGLGGQRFICENSKTVFSCTNGSIMKKLPDGNWTEIIQAEGFTCMAANEDAVFYHAYDEDEMWTIRRLNLYSWQTENLCYLYGVIGMRGNGDEVFVNAVNNWQEEERRQNVLCYHKLEDEVNLNDLVDQGEPAYMAGEYGVYEWNGYRLVVKTDAKGAEWIVLVENDEGFHYSCAEENVYAKIGDEYLELISGKTLQYHYRGETKELPEIMDETNPDEYETAFYPSHVSVYDGAVYILAQYCSNVSGVSENPSWANKGLDALFKLQPDTGECTLIYRCQEGEQLGGYSAKDNCVYLMGANTALKYNPDTQAKETLVTYGGFYAVKFECLEDSMYVWGRHHDDKDWGMLYQPK